MNLTRIVLYTIVIINYFDDGVALAIPRASSNSSNFPIAENNYYHSRPPHQHRHQDKVRLNITGEDDTLISLSSRNDEIFVDINPLNMAFTKRPSVCDDCVCGSGRKMKIVGGTVASIAEFPWMVGMTEKGQFHCGGSLITRKHVLTAAHCLEGFDKRYFEVHMGDEKVSKTGDNVIRRRIKSWTLHKDFNSYNSDNDIAIIELDHAVPLNGHIRTACLPENRAIDYTGSLAIAIGWGRTTEGGDISSELRKVRVPVLSDEECDEAGYQKTRITENMFCAGYLEGLRDACSGDSGGPLLVKGPHNHLEIIGITSFGRGCARPRYPGVYTKLTNYLGWLSDELNNECICPPSS